MLSGQVLTSGSSSWASRLFSLHFVWDSCPGAGAPLLPGTALLRHTLASFLLAVVLARNVLLRASPRVAVTMRQ